MNLSCSHCDVQFKDRKSILAHLRLLPVTEYFCRECNRNYKSLGSYRNHLPQNHPKFPHTASMAPSVNLDPDDSMAPSVNLDAADSMALSGDLVPDDYMAPLDIDIDDSMDYEPLAPQNAETTIPVKSPLDDFKNAFERVVEFCFQEWLSFLNHPDATIDSGNRLCSILIKTIDQMVDAIKPVVSYGNVMNLKTIVKASTEPFKSQYHRIKELRKRKLYINNIIDRVDYMPVTVGAPVGTRINMRRHTISRSSIKGTLLSVLTQPSISDQLLMPSTFVNNNTVLNHPLSGTRGKELLEVKFFVS